MKISIQIEGKIEMFDARIVKMFRKGFFGERYIDLLKHFLKTAKLFFEDKEIKQKLFISTGAGIVIEKLNFEMLNESLST